MANMFGKMMSSCPMQMIKGIPDSVKFSAGVGAVAGVYGNRRGHRVSEAVRGAAVGGVIAGGALGFSALGGMTGLSMLGRNAMRNPGMAAKQAMGAARGAYGRVGQLFKNVRRMI